MMMLKQRARRGGRRRRDGRWSVGAWLTTAAAVVTVSVLASCGTAGPNPAAPASTPAGPSPTAGPPCAAIVRPSPVNTWLLVAVIAATLLAVVALAGWWMTAARYRRTIQPAEYRQSQQQPGGGGGPSAVSDHQVAGHSRLADGPGNPQKSALEKMCIELGDMLGERPVLLARLHRGMTEAGYQVITPSTGQPFDDSDQHCVGTWPTDNAELDETVASTERVGYRRGNILVRAAEVIVYQYSTQSSSRA
jgi:hypothetical protein